MITILAMFPIKPAGCVSLTVSSKTPAHLESHLTRRPSVVSKEPL